LGDRQLRLNMTAFQSLLEQTSPIFSTEMSSQNRAAEAELRHAQGVVGLIKSTWNNHLRNSRPDRLGRGPYSAVMN